MLEKSKPVRNLDIDSEKLQIFIERGWISPLILEGRQVLRDIDIARAALIGDLGDAMGVNDEGVELVLDLLDQLYGLRFALANLIDALEVQPDGVQRHLVNDARRLYTLSRWRSCPLR